MAGLGVLISNLISQGTSLLPTIRDSILAPSSSSSSSSHDSKLRAIEDDLERLMRTLKRIQATLRDAERREIRDESVQLWLTELREVAYAADDVLDEWHYEQLKAQVEARNASGGNSNKRKLIQIPDDMADQIKEIRSRFDEICKDHKALRLREEDGVRIPEGAKFPIPTGHLPHESNIFGRENEKEEVINRLLADCDKNNLMVLPIVGMGGLGKTTLAQLVYNDVRVSQQFDKQGWVWVFNDFDVTRLTKTILECVSGDGSNLTELSMLQGQLKTEVDGKSVFLVLDDVWNDQNSLWQSLMAPLISAKRVSILVTTRNESVALVVQTVPFFKLGTLPDEQCWQIFQHYALGGFLNIERSNLEELGRKIMNKCRGLPLAVKSIASLLRYENEERWEEILQSEIWEAYPNSEAFAALRISYMQLPEHLKSCLLFCSMFPKGFFYQAGRLIDQWVAQDYVVLRSRMSIEEVGMEYVKELWQRSFLQVAYNQTYKIHDVVHDLLRLISRGAHRDIHVNSPLNITDKICNHLFVDGHSDLIDRHFLPKQLAMLRTLILSFPSKKVPLNVSYLSYVQQLRILEISFGDVSYLLDVDSVNPMGQMKHLRCLVLYRCYIDLESRWRCYIDLEPIWQLLNLRFLVINNCKLKELPKEFGNLANLISLYLICCGINSLPESFSLLNNLEILYIDDPSFEKLPENIGKLVSLRELCLVSCQLQVVPDSLCKLSNLKILTIVSLYTFYRNWRITKLPEAIGNISSLQKLVISSHINHLPPSFSKIYNYCRSIKLDCVVVGKNDGLGWLKDFGSLQGTLCFERLKNFNNLGEVGQKFLVGMHLLKELVIGWNTNCSTIQPALKDRENLLCVCKLGAMPAEEMSLSVLESLQPHANLKQLALSEYPGNMLPAWMGDPLVCASLQTINIYYCINLSSLSFGNLFSLKNFGLSGCKGLSSLHEGSLPSQLEKLDIDMCDNLVSMPVLLRLLSLVELKISRCPKLRSFVMETDGDANYWLPPASCSIKIWDCPLLK
ncbi:hypothetical protein LUZ61_000332 [Rhynchospora tenuis]|uniref:Disease resistance protein RGA3 n=1 Tax=Rhynchospora tenuis TaxID=198213 RepID=A0AAD6EPR6_9POAL|nr:hypothetical protein LUZ61_000332 [Rhynchospora tenuis]